MKNFIMRDCKNFTEDAVFREQAVKLVNGIWTLTLFVYVFVILWYATPK